MTRWLALFGCLLAAPAWAQTPHDRTPAPPGLPFSGGTLTGPLTAPGITSTGAIAGNVTATGGTTARTLADRAADVVNVLDYGAKGDGVTDDAPAFALAAAAAPNGTIIVPANRTYRLASGISFPGNTSIRSDGFTPDLTSPGGAGAVLQCDLGVPVCVTLGNNNDLSQGLYGITISRAAGTPPAGSIGLLLKGGRNDVLRGVNVVNQETAYYLQADNTVHGISLHASQIFACNITGSYFVDDTWPETYVEDGRFGCTTNPTATSYISVRGGSTSNASSGPNTLHFAHFQFNGAAQYLLNFVNQTPGAISDRGGFDISGSHVEGISTAYIHSDSTWPQIYRLWLTGNNLNSAQPLALLSAATFVNHWVITGNVLSITDLTLAPTNGIDQLVMSGNAAGQANLSLTGLTSSSASLSGNAWDNVTLAGGWSCYQQSDAILGTVANTATGCQSVGSTGQVFAAGNWGAQLTVGRTSQGGRLNFARGTDGAVHAWVGQAGATNQDVELENDSGTPNIVLNANNTGGAIKFQVMGTNYGSVDATGFNAPAFKVGGTAGVTCSGAPSASFAVTSGIVTHC